MSYSSVSNIFRGLAKTSLAAGVILLGLTVSGAQAAMVMVYSAQGGTAGSTGWTAAAGLGGSILEENFGTPVANADGPASVAFGTINFGNSPGFLGRISGDTYSDRVDTDAGQRPLFEFSGLGVTAFGGDWDLGPATPGTNITLFITFADTTTLTLANAILNPSLVDGFVGFFGIVSDMAIVSIELLEGTQAALTETFDLNNARFVSAVPIPAALPLFLSALAALGFVSRRKKRLAAA